jgi:alkyl hydroperoxide reductase subunit AhpC
MGTSRVYTRWQLYTTLSFTQADYKHVKTQSLNTTMKKYEQLLKKNIQITGRSTVSIACPVKKWWAQTVVHISA